MNLTELAQAEREWRGGIVEQCKRSFPRGRVFTVFREPVTTLDGSPSTLHRVTIGCTVALGANPSVIHPLCSTATGETLGEAADEAVRALPQALQKKAAELRTELARGLAASAVSNAKTRQHRRALAEYLPAHEVPRELTPSQRDALFTWIGTNRESVWNERRLVNFATVRHWLGQNGWGEGAAGPGGLVFYSPTTGEPVTLAPDGQGEDDVTTPVGVLVNALPGATGLSVSELLFASITQAAEAGVIPAAVIESLL